MSRSHGTSRIFGRSGTICAVIAGVCPVDLVGETTSVSALVTYLFVHIEVTVVSAVAETASDSDKSDFA